MVWKGRFPGASTFGWVASRENPAPRFCSEIPVPGTTIPLLNVASSNEPSPRLASNRSCAATNSVGWQALFWQVIAATFVMGAVVNWLNRPLAWWIDAGGMTRAGWLAVTIIAGAGIYALVLMSLGLRIANLGMRPR